MKELTTMGKIAVYTNPLVYPVAIGYGLSAIVEAIFGGFVKRTKQNFQKLSKE